MDARVVAPAGRAASKASGECYDEHAARHPYRPPSSRASGTRKQQNAAIGKRLWATDGPVFLAAFPT